jgi:hypothetical protein
VITGSGKVGEYQGNFGCYEDQGSFYWNYLTKTMHNCLLEVLDYNKRDRWESYRL